MSTYLPNQKVDATDFNSFADALNVVIGTPSGPYLPPASPSSEFGYNQTTLAHVSAGNPIYASDWLLLRNTIEKIANHQGTAVSLPSAGHFVAGQPVIAENPPNAFTVAIAAINTNRFSAAGAGATQLQASSSVSRSAPWSTSLYHDILYQFPSPAAMRAYFNSGGQFHFTGNLTGGSTYQAASWATMLSSSGTVVYDYNLFYNTGTSYYEFHRIYGTGTSYGSSGYPHGRYYYSLAGNTYYIQARLENGGQDIRFHLYFDDVFSYIPDIINGTITSSVTMRKASGVYINNPVISFPSASTTSDF